MATDQSASEVTVRVRVVRARFFYIKAAKLTTAISNPVIFERATSTKMAIVTLDNSPVKGTPVECEGTPDECEGTTVDSKETPDEPIGTPDESQGTPDDSHGTPDESQGTPDESDGTPVESDDSPDESECTPAESEGTPGEYELLLTTDLSKLNLIEASEASQKVEDPTSNRITLVAEMLLECISKHEGESILDENANLTFDAYDYYIKNINNTDIQIPKFHIVNNYSKYFAYEEYEQSRMPMVYSEEYMDFVKRVTPEWCK